jgi:hypothetical protein
MPAIARGKRNGKLKLSAGKLKLSKRKSSRGKRSLSKSFEGGKTIYDFSIFQSHLEAIGKVENVGWKNWDFWSAEFKSQMKHLHQGDKETSVFHFMLICPPQSNAEIFGPFAVFQIMKRIFQKYPNLMQLTLQQFPCDFDQIEPFIKFANERKIVPSSLSVVRFDRFIWPGSFTPTQAQVEALSPFVFVEKKEKYETFIEFMVENEKSFKKTGSRSRRLTYVESSTPITPRSARTSKGKEKKEDE